MARQFRFLPAAPVAIAAIAALQGCHPSGPKEMDRVVMVEADCAGDLRTGNLMLHVREGERWRVEFAWPRLSNIWVAAGIGSRVQWRVGDRSTSDVEKIATFARTFAKLVKVLRETLGGHKTALHPHEDGMDETNITPSDPIVSFDPATRLPSRIVGVGRDTNYFWTCVLTPSEMDGAFTDTNSYLRRLVEDGRIRARAPTNLLTLLNHQSDSPCADAAPQK